MHKSYAWHYIQIKVFVGSEFWISGIILLLLIEIWDVTWWRLEKDKGPWQDFMWRKYMPNARQGQNNSVLWSDMLHINDICLSWRKMLIGN
jgi:hypothetical protein